MYVLSLFDGISCGKVALEKAGIEIEKYYASEIDKYAIKTALTNHPDILELGDVKDIKGEDYEDIDIIIGGSPCTNFSFSGKRNGMTTKDNVKVLTLEDYLKLKEEGYEFEGQSYLFWEYARLLKEIKPKYFLLENVIMAKEWEKIITEALGVEPVLINSALVSAATRRRLYWANFPITQPEDKGIFFGDVREHNVPAGNIYYSEKGLDWIRRHEIRTGKKLHIFQDNEKMQMLEATMYKKYSSQRFFGINDTHGIRYITVTECERCMGLPDGYTSAVSNTQAYKQLGNGWNVDTIEHIFNCLKKELQ